MDIDTMIDAVEDFEAGRARDLSELVRELEEEETLK